MDGRARVHLTADPAALRCPMFWTPDEEDKACAHPRNVWRSLKPRRYLPMLTRLVTGIRVGELRVLRRMDLELDGTTPGIWIRMARKTIRTPKNGHARFAPIPRDFVEELQACAALREPEALLFPAGAAGRSGTTSSTDGSRRSARKPVCVASRHAERGTRPGARWRRWAPDRRSSAWPSVIATQRQQIATRTSKRPWSRR